MEYNLYRIGNIDGSVKLEFVDSQNREVNEIVSRLSKRLYELYSNGSESVYGFRTLGNLLSNVIKTEFSDIMTLTENRRAIPFKFNKFLSENPKFILMLGDELGQNIVDKSFPRVTELSDFIEDTLNRYYELKIDINFIIIEIREFEGLAFTELENGRKKLLRHDI